jgi:hypothetical protein
LKTPERLSLIVALKKNAVSLKLLREYEPDILLKLCGDIEKYKTQAHCYSECITIQKELIHDERFFFYLDKMIAANISPKTINNYLDELTPHGEHGVDYPVNRLISSMVYTEDSQNIFYDFLKYFSGLPVNKTQKENIVINWADYGETLNKPCSELTEAEISLLMESCLTNHSLIPGAFKQAFTLLQQDDMLNILRLINEKNYSVKLSINDYEAINNSTKAILGHLNHFQSQLSCDYMNMLLTRWIDNKCSLHDLDVLSAKTGDMDDEQLYEVLSSRSGYINLIYGSKISNMSLAIIPRHKEDILIYAITQKKNGFIRLIEENQDSFNSVGSESILFEQEFYSKHFNINSLNPKDLKECSRMESPKIIFNELEKNRVYTFNEIKVLYGLPMQYYKFYAALDIPRLDNRLIVFRQITKNKILSNFAEDDCIKSLATGLSQKPLSEWRDNEFKHIDGIKILDAAELLIYLDEIQNFIPQLKNRTEVKLLVRNRERVKNYETFNAMKMNLSKIDGVWGALVTKLAFNDEFLNKNQKNVYEFLCMNNAEIANRYYDNLTEDKQREALRRIVQAELMGELCKLKYYADDLLREIDYPLSPKQKSLWQSNSETLADNIVVKECDDFYSTMILGTMPQRTCLSYDDGDYFECLLSGFDSNKKVLFAFIDGKIVGRAVIRFTKGTFNKSKKEENTENTLDFVDLEAVDSMETKKQNESEKDRLVIFLESSYASGISESTMAKIDDMYVDLMDKKATEIDAMLILSNSYAEITRTDFTKTLFHIYISKSKAGNQYLDSLDGSAHISDEGGYRSKLL